MVVGWHYRIERTVSDTDTLRPDGEQHTSSNQPRNGHTPHNGQLTRVAGGNGGDRVSRGSHTDPIEHPVQAALSLTRSRGTTSIP